MLSSGAFNGPQIEKLTQNNAFTNLLSAVEKRAWTAITDVMANFLGTKRANNYKHIVAEMLSAFREMKVNMSLKLHFLHNHIDFFPSNFDDVSNECAEQFLQDIVNIEKHFKDDDVRYMLGEYCSSICRETTDNLRKKK